VLERVLTEFEHLSECQLSQLVQERFANNVVSDLLRAGKDVSSQLTSCHSGAGAGASILSCLPFLFVSNVACSTSRMRRWRWHGGSRSCWGWGGKRRTRLCS
jgi:hypothetical protein